MFKISFSSAIAFHLCFSIFLVFTLWIFYNSRRYGISKETKYLQQCPYCTYLFFEYAAENSQTVRLEGSGGKGAEEAPAKRILSCPRCKSYLPLEDPPKTAEN